MTLEQAVRVIANHIIPVVRDLAGDNAKREDVWIDVLDALDAAVFTRLDEQKAESEALYDRIAEIEVEYFDATAKQMLADEPGMYAEPLTGADLFDDEGELYSDEIAGRIAKHYANERTAADGPHGRIV